MRCDVEDLNQLATTCFEIAEDMAHACDVTLKLPKWITRPGKEGMFASVDCDFVDPEDVVLHVERFA